MANGEWVPASYERQYAPNAIGRINKERPGKWWWSLLKWSPFGGGSGDAMSAESAQSACDAAYQEATKHV